MRTLATAKHDKTILNSHYFTSNILMPLTTKYDNSLSRDQIYFINIHCAFGPHTLAIAITGSTADSGTTSETPRLDITDEMPAAPMSAMCPLDLKPVSSA